MSCLTTVGKPESDQRGVCDDGRLGWTGGKGETVGVGGGRGVGLLMELLEDFLVFFALLGRQLVADVLKGILHGLADLPLTLLDKFLNGIVLLWRQLEGGIHFLHQGHPVTVKIGGMRGGNVEGFRGMAGSGGWGGIGGMGCGGGISMEGGKKVALSDINQQTPG